MSSARSFSVYRKIDGSPNVSVQGQVFTKPHIVEFMLDLCGYTPDKALHNKTLLEPGSGDGAFLVAAAKRLLDSRPTDVAFAELAGCITGVERDSELVRATRTRLSCLLREYGVPTSTTRNLVKKWVTCDDFLKEPPRNRYDFVVGNPPYIRQEAIPRHTLAQYRKDFACFYDRADVYVAFFEQALRSLSQDGTLAFICPNRFTRNNYGRKLRALITHSYNLTHMVDLAEASAFEPDVLSYPAIFVIEHGVTSHVDHVTMCNASEAECSEALRALSDSPKCHLGSVAYHQYSTWFRGEDRWCTHTPAHLSLLRRLESNGVPIGHKSSGCRVGIGVATGADDVFIIDKNSADIEPELLLPLVGTKDISSGRVEWRERYLINPFDETTTNGLIHLDDFPKAKQYFHAHEARLRSRNVGKRNPLKWYRTIDRIHHKWTDTPMILIPDIKGNNHTIALKPSGLYPHHNLYFVTSEHWDLRLLQGILKSDIARFFVFMHGVKMRQGYYRFQAQYLRRICLPNPMTLSKQTIQDVKDALKNDDREKLNGAVARMHDLSANDVALLQSFDEPT